MAHWVSSYHRALTAVTDNFSPDGNSGVIKRYTYYAFKILHSGCWLVRLKYSMMAEMTDTTNISKVRSSRHIISCVNPYVFNLGIRFYAACMVVWSYCNISSPQTSILVLIYVISLAQLLEGCLHDLPKDSQIYSVKTYFLKNILIFFLALFQLRFLLSPGLSLSFFLKKHSRHQSP